MARYAANTEVSSDRSRAEIEKTLQRYGASRFMYGWEETGAAVMFEMKGRRIRFLLPMPNPHDRKFTHTPGKGIKRSPEAHRAEYEQAVRQKWRALALAIKAKLEAVESGIAEFEEEFLAYVVLPNGQSVGPWLKPQIAAAYENGKMPPMLPSPEK